MGGTDTEQGYPPTVHPSIRPPVRPSVHLSVWVGPPIPSPHPVCAQKRTHPLCAQKTQTKGPGTGSGRTRICAHAHTFFAILSELRNCAYTHTKHTLHVVQCVSQLASRSPLFVRASKHIFFGHRLCSSLCSSLCLCSCSSPCCLCVSLWSCRFPFQRHLLWRC